MISKFKNNEARKSALIYRSNFEQVQELYEDDKEMAGELAISILEMALTGEISSDDKMIRLMLKNFEVSAESNKQKYEAKERNTKEEKAKTYKLYEIAEMLNEGKTQAEIATALGVSRQTISRRLNEMIRVEYPELLCSNGEMSNDVKQCKNNDNDNDNDNVKENEKENENNENDKLFSCEKSVGALADAERAGVSPAFVSDKDVFEEFDIPVFGGKSDWEYFKSVSSPVSMGDALGF